MLRFLLLPALAALAALATCGTPPPSTEDARTAAYRADYEGCDTAVPDAVDKRNAKTGLAWFASPVRRWGQISEGMRQCMADKGWGETRACTAAELAAGDRTPGLHVTSAGVRCSDPARR